MTTTVLFGLLGLTILFLLSAILHIGRIQSQLKELDKEQHQQNEEIIQLMKANMQHGEMLLQHIEILKYLVEQDPQLGKVRIPYGGVVGEA
jgi:hypothetical protein